MDRIFERKSFILGEWRNWLVVSIKTPIGRPCGWIESNDSRVLNARGTLVGASLHVLSVFPSFWILNHWCWEGANRYTHAESERCPRII